MIYDFSQFSDIEIIGSIQSRLFLQIIHNIFNNNFDEELENILSLFRKLNNTNTVLEYFEIAMKYIINVRELGINDIKEKVNKQIPEGSDKLMTLADKLREEGKQKGIQTGKLQELRETISIQLPKKFNTDKLPEDLQKTINSADLDKLEKIRDNIFEIDSIEEVRKYLN